MLSTKLYKHDQEVVIISYSSRRIITTCNYIIHSPSEYLFKLQQYSILLYYYNKTNIIKILYNKLQGCIYYSLFFYIVHQQPVQIIVVTSKEKMILRTKS